MSNKINKYEDQLSKSTTMREMHLPTKEGDSLFSVHQRGKQKTLWYLSKWDFMEAQNVPTNRELVTYNSKVFPYHFLHRSILTTVIPEIEANEGYQIRFCDDLFINMIKEYRFIVNDVEFQMGNNKSLTFDFKRNKKWDEISQELGNRGNITKWGSKIESEEISIQIPWCYTRDKSDAFPLKFFGHNDKVQHVIEFNLDLSELILIKDSDGKKVDYDPELLTISGNTEFIPIPEMEGLYTSLTEAEYSSSKSNTEEYNSESVYYVEDENEVGLGKKVQIKFDSKNKFPVHEVHWGALNITRTNDTRSLTFTDENDRTPVRSSKLESSIGVVMDNKVSYKTEKGYLIYKDYRVPAERGLNFWENSILDKEDPRKFTPGLNLGGGNISVTLNKGSPSSKEKYLVFSILKHTKRFKFKNFPVKLKKKE